MLKTLLLVVIPLLMPTLLYVAWLFLVQRRAGVAGGPWYAQVPWHWVSIAGAGFLFVVLALIALAGGDPPGGTYVPAEVIDGRVVPGRVVGQ
jgi:hypothetical protein